jgi:tripartite-type tricarboxylate transporter receptor subunit TctC
VREALADPKVRESLIKLGLTPGGGDQAQFIAHLKREGDKWGKVIEQAGVKSTEE